MTTALVALTLLAIAIWLSWRRVVVHVALEARGNRSGHWALAGGIASHGVSLTGVAARDRSATMDLRVMSRAIWTRRAGDTRRRTKKTERNKRKPWRTAGRWATAALELAWRLASRIGIRRVDGGIDMTLRDVAAAAWIEGALSVVSALVSCAGHLRHHVRYDPEERLGVSVAIDVDFRPIHIVWDTMVVLYRSVMRTRQRPVPEGARAT